MTGQPLRVVVLTNAGSMFGKRVLHELVAAGIAPSGIVVVRQPLSYYWRLFRRVARHVGVPDAVVFSLARLNGAAQGRRNAISSLRYEDLGAPVLRTAATNSLQTIAALQALEPDLVLLGQTGIVGRELLAIPRLGTLNAHPGLLPWYRGIDCARWAVLNGDLDKLGTSVHWVDEGVDTGPVIASRRYQIGGPVAMDELDEALEEDCASLLAEVVRVFQLTGIAAGTPQECSQGARQYFKMSRREEAEVAGMLRGLPSGS